MVQCWVNRLASHQLGTLMVHTLLKNASPWSIDVNICKLALKSCTSMIKYRSANIWLASRCLAQQRLRPDNMEGESSHQPQHLLPTFSSKCIRRVSSTPYCHTLFLLIQFGSAPNEWFSITIAFSRYLRHSTPNHSPAFSQCPSPAPSFLKKIKYLNLVDQADKIPKMINRWGVSKWLRAY